MTTTSADHHKEKTSLIDTLSKENKERNCFNPSSSSKGEDLITIDQKQVSSSTTTETSSMEDTDQARDAITNPNEGDHRKLILSARAEMDRVREENEKLKQTLSQMLKDYKSLQMHLHEVFQHEARKDGDVNAGPDPTVAQEDEELELVSLSLGRVSDKPRTTTDEKKANGVSKLGINTDMEYDEGLTLGLDCSKFDLKKHSRLENNSVSHKREEEETTDATPQPVSGLKTERNEDNDILLQIPLKKARVSVRARCDAPTMNDGCQWKKYGQKIAKGNPCPRAYYRCTISSSCPVRKHVQRWVDDKSILITTYEGTHNHPLPASAKAMASMTSAAASMLKSPSTTSSQPGISGGSGTTSYASLYGLNYNSRINQYPVYIPSPTISNYQSHPTITLDLTASSTNFLTAPRFSSTSLNFSSPASSSSLESNYRNHMHGFSYLGRPMLKDTFYQTPNYMHSKDSMQQSSAETIAAATKALTSNPTFRSALAASITSFVGNVGAGGQM